MESIKNLPYNPRRISNWNQQCIQVQDVPIEIKSKENLYCFPEIGSIDWLLIKLPESPPQIFQPIKAKYKILGSTSPSWEIEASAAISVEEIRTELRDILILYPEERVKLLFGTNILPVQRASSGLISKIYPEKDLHFINRKNQATKCFILEDLAYEFEKRKQIILRGPKGNGKNSLATEFAY